MLERQFVWTAIPAGRTVTPAGESAPMALLSVLVTLRLRSDGAGPLTVASFGMQRWPERLAAVQFTVHPRGGDPVAAVRVPYVTLEGREIRFTVAEQLRCWTSILDAATSVRPYGSTTYAGRRVETFPAGEAADATREAYGAAARAHVDHGGESPSTNPALRAALQTLRATRESSLRDGSGESAFARGYDFYRREDLTPLPSPDRARADAPPPEFHDLLAKLADHPLLLRALGLVVDLAVPASALAGRQVLRVVPEWPSPPPPGWADAVQRDITPGTAFRLFGTRFVPGDVATPLGSPASRVRDGLLPLQDAGSTAAPGQAWQVVPFDVDGAVVRMVGAGRASAGVDVPGPAALAADDALPALRSAGLALVQRDRAQALGERVQRAGELEDAQALHGAVLTADDLVGGYRIDVWDSRNGRWSSLCERRVRYVVGGVEVGGAAGELEEGFVNPLSAATGGGPQDALYLHEAVARWDGWSLAVQRPDRVVETGDEPPPGQPDLPFEAITDIAAGSLPRLRFGRFYRLRARIADLTGGGVRRDAVGPDEEATAKIPYLRFEPVLPPEVLPTRELRDGETHERLVIRSDQGVTVEQYAQLHGHRPYDLRVVLAPKSSLDLALQHPDTFDGGIGADATEAEIAKLLEVAKRADLGVMDIPGAQVAGGEDDRLSPQPYVVVPENVDRLPWLADPLAVGVALHELSREPTATGAGPCGGLPVQCPWRAAWPDRPPISLRLVPASGGCTVTHDPQRASIVVALGPAEQLELEVSSFPEAHNVDLLGFSAWSGSGSKVAIIAAGRHRMITPPRTLKLVHAVQRPRPPAGQLVAQRQVGDTFAVLRVDALAIDTDSTLRIDIRARWREQVDVPPSAPHVREHDITIGSYDIPRGPLQLEQLRHEFGDTRRRRVRFEVTALSRFADYFGDLVANDPDACVVRADLPVVDVPSSARPPAPKVPHLMPTFKWDPPTFTSGETIRRRRGGGVRVFLERPWFSSGADEKLGVLVWPSPGFVTPDSVVPFVSVMGRDPLFESGNPGWVLSRDDIHHSMGAVEELPEAAHALHVTAHDVEYDAGRDLWFADLDLGKVAANSYFPFVRLVLVRYQPNSVSPAHRLSSPVTTEPIQLPPHRTLRVQRASGSINVTLEGIGPTVPPSDWRVNWVGLELQVFDPSATGAAAPVELDPDAPVAIAGWNTIQTLGGVLGSSTSIDVPDVGLRPLRVLVTEYERLPSGVTESGWISTTIEAQRRVFADVIDLTAVKPPKGGR